MSANRVFYLARAEIDYAQHAICVQGDRFGQRRMRYGIDDVTSCNSYPLDPIFVSEKHPSSATIRTVGDATAWLRSE